MHYEDGNADELKRDFWYALDNSPFLFLQLDSDPDSAIPMTAQLDKDAKDAIWFFTTKDHPLGRMGHATATFASKGHELFARFRGTLFEETDHGRFEKQWSNFVAAWYPDGKESDNILMLRMELRDAEIWNARLGAFTTAKMALGMNVRDEAAGKHVETTL